MAHRTRRLPGIFDPDYFWPHVDRSGGPDACWPWTRGRFDNGYGQVPMPAGYSPLRAHRVALVLTCGEPDGHKLACHHCDNRICCNPAHLYWGTQKQNLGDAAARGRLRRRNQYTKGKP